MKISLTLSRAELDLLIIDAVLKGREISPGMAKNPSVSFYIDLKDDRYPGDKDVVSCDVIYEEVAQR